MEPLTRFELVTPSLPWKCSTPELQRHLQGLMIPEYGAFTKTLIALLNDKKKPWFVPQGFLCSEVVLVLQATQRVCCNGSGIVAA